jgi:hypothetical protein
MVVFLFHKKGFCTQIINHQEMTEFGLDLECEDTLEDIDLPLEGLESPYCIPLYTNEDTRKKDIVCMPIMDLEEKKDPDNNLVDVKNESISRLRCVAQFITKIITSLVPYEIRRKHCVDIWLLHHLLRQLLSHVIEASYSGKVMEVLESITKDLRYNQKVQYRFIKPGEMYYDYKEGEITVVGGSMQSGRLLVLAMVIAKTCIRFLNKEAIANDNNNTLGETRKRIRGLSVDETIESGDSSVINDVLPRAKREFKKKIVGFCKRIFETPLPKNFISNKE